MSKKKYDPYRINTNQQLQFRKTKLERTTLWLTNILQQMQDEPIIDLWLENDCLDANGNGSLYLLEDDPAGNTLCGQFMDDHQFGSFLAQSVKNGHSNCFWRVFDSRSNKEVEFSFDAHTRNVGWMMEKIDEK